MQIELGEPSMTTRILAVAAAAFFMSPAAQAVTVEDLTSAVLNCSAQPNDPAKLSCLNQLAARLKANAEAPRAQAQPPAPAPQTRTTSAAPESPPARQEAKDRDRDKAWYDVGNLFGSSKESAPPPRRVVGTPADFGKESMGPKNDEPVPLDSIKAGVTKVSYNRYRRFIVTLDNGQVWRQTDSDTLKARFSTTEKNTVTITRGLLGSFHLSIDGLRGGYQVRRVK